MNFGLIKDQEPIFGLIAQPFTGTIWFSFKGKAWKLNKNKELLDAKNIYCSEINIKKLKVVSSLSHRSKDLENWINMIKPIFEENIGSSIKFCILAEGKMDLYPRN